MIIALVSTKWKWNFRSILFGSSYYPYIGVLVETSLLKCLAGPAVTKGQGSGTSVHLFKPICKKSRKQVGNKWETTTTLPS